MAIQDSQIKSTMMHEQISVSNKDVIAMRQVFHSWWNNDDEESSFEKYIFDIRTSFGLQILPENRIIAR